MTTEQEQAEKTLTELGLNQLEAEVYAYLVRTPPVTAYAVGKAIGKATANVYKAVESLARMGAVLIEEGDPKVCRAVPPSEFLSAMRRALELKAEAAEVVLSQLQSAEIDERIYRMEDSEAIFERGRRMLDAASRVVIVDAFPGALERIAPAAVQAAARGVEVRVEAYREIDLPGCDVVVAATGQGSVDHWRSEQLNVVVDGRQVLLALLSTDLDRVYQAVWSRSLYLACLIHSGRMSEHTLHRVRHAARGESADSPVRRAIEGHRFFVDDPVPGQVELARRFVVRVEAES